MAGSKRKSELGRCNTRRALSCHARTPTHRSNTPANIMLVMANVVSAGMPTSHGRKYFFMPGMSLPIMSHGCTKTEAPSSSAAGAEGKGRGGAEQATGRAQGSTSGKSSEGEQRHGEKQALSTMADARCCRGC